jgi:hypothetical protein
LIIQDIGHIKICSIYYSYIKEEYDQIGYYDIEHIVFKSKMMFYMYPAKR